MARKAAKSATTRVSKAVRDLFQESTNSSFPPSGASAAPAITLDDLGILIPQLEPDDLPGLRRLQGMLDTLAGAGSLSADALGEIEKCRQVLGGCLEQQNPHDAGVVLSEIARLLEAAGNAVEARSLAGNVRPAKKTVQVAPNSAPVSTIPQEKMPVPVISAPAAAKPDLDEFLTQLPSDVDAELLGEFINESREYIEGAEAALLTLENDPLDHEAINTVFRAFHTIKGTSGFLNLKAITQLAHRAESLLSRVRDKEIRCTGGYADLALQSIDMLKELTLGIQNALGGAPMARPHGYDKLNRVLADTEAAGVSEEATSSTSDTLRLGDILVAEGKVTREDIEMLAIDQGNQPLGVALVQSGVASVTDVAQALRVQKRINNIKADGGVESSVRVSTNRLDRLIDMVGELVIAQSMVAQDATVLQSDQHELLKKVTHSGKIVRELQDLSMSMRMVPLKATFQKMNRLVRDLAMKSGKKVCLMTDDKDTEIDRNMVDIINDLLVHMVRNSVDHGIEPPEVREQAGKDPTGSVMLSAFHSGGSVVVEIKDDGKGLDRNKIIQKAIAKGLLESDKSLTDSEVYNLVFAPGFSTADIITDISGRGVGMDVVRKGVESLRGRIDIESEAGKGCTFSVRLPLTLAITDGMLVSVGEEHYIIPTVNISMSFRPSADALFTVSGRGEMVMLRGELLPLFRLHRLFKVQGAIQDPTRALLVVVGESRLRCALMVDELLGQQQVVAKTLGEGIGKVEGVAGGAILGNGCVGLILDPVAIATLARQVSSTVGNGDLSITAA